MKLKVVDKRMLFCNTKDSSLKRVVLLTCMCSVTVWFLLWSIYFLHSSNIHMIQTQDGKLQFSDLRSLQTHDSINVHIVVLVLSHRDAFDRRDTIRKTWAAMHAHVYFVVSELYCPHPPENRITGQCIAKDKSIKRSEAQRYIETEETISRKLHNESNVVLLQTVDIYEDLEKYIKESYKWALKNLNTEWIFHVEDSVDVKLDSLETYLLTKHDSTKMTALIILFKCESSVDINKQDQSCNSSFMPGFFTPFQCAFNHIVSRQTAEYLQNSGKHIFEYRQIHNYSKVRIMDSSYIQTIHREEDFDLISMDGNNTSTGMLVLDLSFKPNKTSIHQDCKDSRQAKRLQGNETVYTLSENPSNYLHSNRFDLIVKMVYAYFYVHEKRIPSLIRTAYVEHLRVWNNFKEGCSLEKEWYDSKIACTAKRNSHDFIASFHNTIETIKKFGFSSSISRIPIDENGFPNNGAHRLSASVILSKNATFEHHTFKKHIGWGYNFFKQRGMSEKYCNLVMLEWMKIQMKLSYLNTTVSIVSIFSNDRKKDEKTRKIVKDRCSKDDSILYEVTLKITKQGARQLLSHMYGQQSWLEAKIQQMSSKFNLTYNALFLFVYSKSIRDLLQCKNVIRKHYSDEMFKSTAHIPDTTEENLILAEMILNPNSVLFMNYANNAPDCKLIAKEIAFRSSVAEIATLPGIYVGRDDVMIDSGAVLGIFGLRKRTDVDLLFLHKTDKSILGNLHGISIQAHAFINNSISKERAWGEDHFSDGGATDEWDLFYEPTSFGYCYGIRFVSLKQLVRYKIKRNEPKKDANDVELINGFLNKTSINN